MVTGRQFMKMIKHITTVICQLLHFAVFRRIDKDELNPALAAQPGEAVRELNSLRLDWPTHAVGIRSPETIEVVGPWFRSRIESLKKVPFRGPTKKAWDA